MPLATLVAPPGMLNVGADLDIATAFVHDKGTLVLTGATAASVSGLNFHNLVINKGTAGTTVTSTGGWAVANALTMTQGTWITSTFMRTIGGAWNSSGANFTFTAGTSTITLGSASPTITTKGIRTDPFDNLTLSSGVTLATDVQTNGTLTVSAGQRGQLCAEHRGKLGDRSRDVERAVRQVTFTGTGTILPALTFWNLTIAASASTMLGAATLGINNTLNLGGTLSAGACIITMAGAQWNNTGTFARFGSQIADRTVSRVGCRPLPFVISA